MTEKGVAFRQVLLQHMHGEAPEGVANQVHGTALAPGGQQRGIISHSRFAMTVEATVLFPIVHLTTLEFVEYLICIVCVELDVIVN